MYGTSTTASTATRCSGGAYYAPDLTKITQHRGEPYLKAYMRDPSKFYDEKIHRRLMPRQDLSEEEISDLIAFLDWVSKVDNQGWPPRPILVTGSFVPGADTLAQGSAGRDDAPPGARPVAADDDERALGEKVFRTAVPACNACHSTAPGADMAGPTLAGIATRAARIVESPDYQGRRKTPAAISMNRSCRPARTSCLARCTRRTGRPSCPPVTTRA